MAESQVPFPYDTAVAERLREALSQERFGTYLNAAGNDEQLAFDLYLYNSRLAKAFLYPLSMVEVTLRNRIDLILTSKYGSDWPRNAAFRASLSSVDAQQAIAKAISRAGPGPKSKVVAALTLDFWSNLFRKDYHDLWRFTLHTAFPNLPRKVYRDDIQSALRKINDFRNRVAHHEPIIAENAPQVLSTIYKVTGYCSTDSLTWLRHHVTVAEVLRTRPTTAGRPIGQKVSSRADPNFLAVTRGTTLDKLGGMTGDHPIAVCLEENGSVHAAFTIAEVMAFTWESASKDAGYAMPSAFTVGQMLDASPKSFSWQTIGQEALLTTAAELLKAPFVRVLVITDANGHPTGVIERAHRRY